MTRRTATVKIALGARNVLVCPVVFTLVVDLRPDDAATMDTFTLRATDGSFSQTLTLEDGLRLDDERVLLSFTGLLRGRLYSLSCDLAGAAALPIFTAVPVAGLDDHGDETPAPDRVELGEAPEPDDGPGGALAAGGRSA